MSRKPDAHREAERADLQSVREFGYLKSLLAYFAQPRDWWDQPYWPPGSHGKVHNFLHGRGWRVT